MHTAGHLLCEVTHSCLFLQRIGKYDQHSADQLNPDESPVEHMQVIREINQVKIHDTSIMCIEIIIMSPHLSEGTY